MNAICGNSRRGFFVPRYESSISPASYHRLDQSFFITNAGLEKLKETGGSVFPVYKAIPGAMGSVENAGQKNEVFGRQIRSGECCLKHSFLPGVGAEA